VPTVGDYFSAAEKQEHIDTELRSGRILYLYCQFTDPPKDKFLLLACRSDPPLLFMINSEIRGFIRRRPDLLSSQVRLKASVYNFLSHDSFMDCSEVINRFGEEAIINQILSDVGRIKGKISRAMKREVVAVVKKARTITPADKELIIQALKQ